MPATAFKISWIAWHEIFDFFGALDDVSTDSDDEDEIDEDDDDLLLGGGSLQFHFDGFGWDIQGDGGCDGLGFALGGQVRESGGGGDQTLIGFLCDSSDSDFDKVDGLFDLRDDHVIQVSFLGDAE